MKDDLPVDQKPVSPPDDFINFNPCEFNPAMRETETQLDIQLSSGYADRSRREQAARSRWEAEGILPSNPVATAAALSDGAVVAANGLGVAMCNVDGDWIKATEPLKASASGRTNLDLDFAGEENEDASVSAAVLVLAEADSEVAGESAETIENLATAGEVLGWLPGPVGEIAPVIIEAIANADAESSVTATFQYSIDPVPAARGAVSARAARHLIVKQGSFVSPPEDEYGQRHVVGGMISGSGSPGVGVQIDAECESNVRSDGLWASCRLSSLWAVVWAGCCKQRIGETTRTISRYGMEARFNLYLPTSKEFKADTVVKLIENSMRNRLKDLMDEYFSDGRRACADEAERETVLRDVLFIWQNWIAAEWSLFTDADFDPDGSADDATVYDEPEDEPAEDR